MSCPFTQPCPFFNDQLPNTPIVAKLLKRKYCLSDDYQTCARYRVLTDKGYQYVPPTLFPDMVEEAEQIINHGTD